jgi:hypothetical protein
MHSKLGKKLSLARETLRSLSALKNRQLATVAGGISGLRGCHSIRDFCQPGSGGALCDSDATDCNSGAGIATCTCAG